MHDHGDAWDFCAYLVHNFGGEPAVDTAVALPKNHFRTLKFFNTQTTIGFARVEYNAVFKVKTKVSHRGVPT